MSSQILLMTATITPPAGAPALKRVNVDDRRADYAHALRHNLQYLGRGIDRLVFSENSASDVSDLREIVQRAGHQDRVEFLSFHGLEHPPAYGRAYGEFKLIDYTMANSETLRDADPGQIVWKLTGRYIIPNLEEMLVTQPKSFDLYLNMRNYPKRWADMFLMAWSRRGHEEFLRGLCERLRQDQIQANPEEVFRDLVDGARGKVEIVPRFRRVAVVDGVRGFNNRNYLEGEGKLKHVARRLATRLTPWIWI